MVENEHFVARQQELERLHAFLDLTLKGNGQICLLAGDAGAGKTALAVEFAHQAQAQHKDLIAAAGLCDPLLGSTLPYAPFREALAVLTGAKAAQPARRAISMDNTSRVGNILNFTMEALLEFGPDLVGTFIPGSTLAIKTGKFLFDQTGLKEKFSKRLTHKDDEPALMTAARLSQDQLFEQYTNVIARLTQKSPLILIIEDLHWADNSTLDLLFRLSRRLETYRLLLIATFRPHEMSTTRGAESPSLEKVINELKRYRGDILVDLNQTEASNGRAFVEAYLNSEPNRLDVAFRDKLFEHTLGHPLFTVELLRDFQERGILAKDEQGRWIVSHDLDWEHIPARVEGVIAGRIQGLAADLRQDLTIASVEGTEFTAEVIAQVQQEDARLKVGHLSGELQKTYQLVEGQDVRRIGQQRISRYRFSHNLFQRYLYQTLDPIEASYLHESVGLALEALYGDQANEIAAQLARHFELAEMPDKAVGYLVLAAEQTASIYANQTALSYIHRALALLQGDQAAERFSVLALRERIYDLQAQRDLQRADLAELTRLADKLPDPQRKRVELTLRRGKLALDVSDYNTTIHEARLAIELLQRDPALQEAYPFLRVDAHLLWAMAATQRGDAPAARRQQLEQAELTSRQQGYLPGEARAQELLGTLCWSESNYPAAKENLERALQLARQSGDLRREWSVLNNTGVVTNAQGDFTAAVDYYQQALEIVHRIGDRIGEGVLLSNLGESHLALGQFAEARIYSNHALELSIDIDDRIGEAIAMINLSDAFRETGLYTQAQEVAMRALAVTQTIGYCRGEAILQEILGRIAQSQANMEQAIQCAQQSQIFAQEVGSRSQQASALVLLGDTYLVADRLDEAKRAYQEALTVLANLDNASITAQARAGLARLSIQSNKPEDRNQARDMVEELVDKLQSDPALSRSLPLRVHLRCAEILKALHHTLTENWIAQTIEELHARAANINDENMRRAFLENIPEHRALRELAHQL